jgi:putative oxidoreductase
MSAPAGTGYWQRYGPMWARVCFSPLLIGYAVYKIRALMGSEQADVLQNFPVTQAMVYLTVAIELLGGIAVLLGFKTRIAASILVVFFLGVTALMVPQLSAPGGIGAVYLDQMFKNLAFIGGLLLLAIHGPGPISIDHRLARRELEGLTVRR